MSVFVNLGLVADSKKDNAKLSSRTKGQNIVANPSLYSVGVNRFKIPLGSIPLFRIYDGDLQMGLYANNPLNYDDLNFKMKLMDVADFRASVFGNKIDSSGNILNQIQSNAMVGYGVESGVAYKDIFSQEEFADYLNLAMCRIVGNMGGGCFTKLPLATTQQKIMVFKNTTTLNGGHDFKTEVGDPTNLIGSGGAIYTYSGKRFLTARGMVNAPANYLTSLPGDKFFKFPRGQVQAKNADGSFANEVMATTHRYITSLEVKLTNLEARFGTQSQNQLPNFKDMSIWLRRVPIDSGGSETTNESIGRLEQGDYDNWCLCQNMLDGLSTSQTGKTIVISSLIGASTTKDNKNFINFSSHLTGDYNIAFDYTTIKDIIGKRGDGYKYEVYTMSNYDYHSKVANSQDKAPYFHLDQNHFEVEIKFDSISSIRTIEPISGNNTGEGNYVSDALGTQDRDKKLIPYFSYNESKKKFEYNISNHYLLGMGFNLIMNKKLAEMFSFQNLIIDECVNNLQMSKYIKFTGNIPYDSVKDDAVVLYPTPTYGSMGVSRNNKSTWFSMNKYEEEANSEFKRDWLNGIVITTGGLAIDGEIVGDGSISRKVLTDFQIDPTSVGRDYLVFTNSGGMRLYGIKSTQPLQDIDAQIQFQDVKGKLRDLIVGYNEECNIKLEFRPNSQLYSLNQDISSFEF